MKDEEILRSLSEEIVGDMDSWSKSNPDATFLDIEEKDRDMVSRLEVALAEKVALEREEENWAEKMEEERPTCPKCKVPLVSRGKRMRNLQGAAGREIKLKRTGRGPVQTVEQAFLPAFREIGTATWRSDP